MTVRWVTPLLGTAAASEIQDAGDVAVVDVRDLVDKAGNRPDTIQEKIREAVNLLAQVDAPSFAATMACRGAMPSLWVSSSAHWG